MQPGAKNRNQRKPNYNSKGPSKYITESSTRVDSDGMEHVTVTARKREPVKPAPKATKMAAGGKVRGDGACMKGRTKGRER